jgi:endonuclease/exonuclease/phosphatase family metal-dependent hydrolase
MRILTWNLGLYSWFKYGRSSGLKINGEKIKHEYFQKQYLEEIAAEITKIDPDICIFQEFYAETDRQLMIARLNKKYPYSCSISSWYHDHTIMIFSRAKIETKELPKTGFWIVQTNNFSLIPFHLHSFVPGKRLKQIKNLFTELAQSKEKIDCLAGDTNLWHFPERHLFLFQKDKKTYSLLTKKFTDSTKEVGRTTKAFTSFDKIFLAKNIEYKNPTCIRKNGKYMDHYPVFVDIMI